MSKHVCKCPRGFRSSQCDFHGSCLCAYGASCPTHDEPEVLRKIQTHIGVSRGQWLVKTMITGSVTGAQARIEGVVGTYEDILELGAGQGNFIEGESLLAGEFGPVLGHVRRLSVLEELALA